MRIEIRKAKRGWTWAFVARNGKQTANNEVFATKGSATRAAKNVVRAIIKRVGLTTDEGGMVQYTPTFTVNADATIITFY